MNRQRFLTRKPSRPCSYRPQLDHLENRVVPAPVTFQVRPALSSITLDPKLVIGTTEIPITEQGPGSLTTGYVGRQKGDLDIGGLTIQFATLGTNIFARNSGSWQPLSGGGTGSEPANYGGYFSFAGDNWVALRAVAVNLSSDPLPLTSQGGGDYTFPPTLTFSMHAGTLDYQTGFFGSGTTSFTGSASNTSSETGLVHDNGNGSYNVTVPVEGSFFVCLNMDCSANTTVKFKGVMGAIVPPAPAPPPGYGFNPVDAGRFFGKAPVSVGAPGSTDVATLDLSKPLQTVDSATAQSKAADGGSTRAIAKVAQHHVDQVFVDPLKLNGL